MHAGAPADVAVNQTPTRPLAPAREFVIRDAFYAATSALWAERHHESSRVDHTYTPCDARHRTPNESIDSAVDSPELRAFGTRPINSFSTPVTRANRSWEDCCSRQTSAPHHFARRPRVRGLR